MNQVSETTAGEVGIYLISDLRGPLSMSTALGPSGPEGRDVMCGDKHDPRRQGHPSSAAILPLDVPICLICGRRYPSAVGTWCCGTAEHTSRGTKVRAVKGFL